MKFLSKLARKLSFHLFDRKTGTKVIQSAEKKIDGVKWVVQIETLNSFAAN